MLPQFNGVQPQVGLYQKLNLRPSTGALVTVKNLACSSGTPSERHDIGGTGLARPAALGDCVPDDAIPGAHRRSLGQALHGVVIGARGSRLRRGLCVVEKSVDHGKGRGCVFAHFGGEGSPEIVPCQRDAGLPLDLFMKPLPRRERLAGSGEGDEQGVAGWSLVDQSHARWLRPCRRSA